MKRKNKARLLLLGQWILKKILPSEESQYFIEGLEERYVRELADKGRLSAWFWYLKDIFCTIPLLIIHRLSGNGVMFKNYIKVALRNLKRYKVFSFINITGLTIGISCTILMLVYVQHELSYDKFHKNAENIYKVVHKTGEDWNGLTPGALKPALLDEMPEVITAVRICPWGGYIDFNGSISHDDRRYTEDNFFIVDAEFLDTFTYPLISGNPEKALSEPFSVVLTQKMADKYFGKQDPMGKILKFDNQYEYKITGILEDVPANSHLMFDFLISLETMFATSYRERKGDLINWGHSFSAIYIQLENGSNPHIFDRKLQSLVETHTGDKSEQEFYLQPLTKIYLNPINPPIGKSNDIRYIYLLIGIALIIVLLACFNYMNLSTARSTSRIREIGIRKIVGANRRLLIMQFLGESILFAFISLVISIFLAKLLLPSFSSLIERDLNFALLNESWILSALICVTFLVGLISGSYPALYLSSLKPLNTLREGFKVGSKHFFGVRHSLVIIQFVVSIGLIICTLTVYNQLRFIKETNLGFSRDHIIVVPVAEMEAERDYEPIRSELSQHSRILEISLSSSLPSLITGGGDARWEGKTDENIRFVRGFVDYNFLDFYDIELLEGRNFSKSMTTDIKQAYILNETAVRAIGWTAPIGKKFNQWGDEDGVVIGVINDFHFLSLHQKIEPLVLSLIQNEWEEARYVSLKISSNDIASTLSFVEEKFNEFSPDYHFRYSFLDEYIDRMYNSERKLGESFITFTMIALFIACLGLFGLTAFTTEQKTKEIGIRKVLGASVSSVVLLLSKELSKRMLIANLIAWPIAWFFSYRWLQNFSYRTNISIWTFVATAAVVFITAMLTVSVQSIKAATANPVDSLRYE
jgi:putative ABC transport system permease protein